MPSLYGASPSNMIVNKLYYSPSVLNLMVMTGPRIHLLVCYKNLTMFEFLHIVSILYIKQ